MYSMDFPNIAIFYTEKGEFFAPQWNKIGSKQPLEMPVS